MRNKKFLNLDKVLCLSPHPDDVEYSMSATIMSHDATQFDIYCLTTGTSTDHTSTAIRYQEVERFWKKLNLKNVQYFFNEDKDSFECLNEAQWLTKIEKLFNVKSYDAILCTPSEDSHFEHQLCNRLMVALGRSHPASLIEYRSPSTLHSWTPNIVVNIEEQFDLKSDCLTRSFISQADSQYFSKDCISLFHSNFAEYKKSLLKFESFKALVHYC